MCIRDRTLNALDRHIKSWRKNKVALIWEGEPGEIRTFTYWQLSRETNKFANVLKSLGVRKGDRVAIYMGRCPEQAIAMLACARIGAVHTVVYGGLSTDALRSRIEDAEAKVVIVSDGNFLNGKIIKLKDIADQALEHTPSVETCIVVKRTGHQINMQTSRDYWWHEMMGLPIASPICEPEPMDAEDPFFIIYTSGSTGRPKGIVHSLGGYMVDAYSTLHDVMDFKEEDSLFCTSDAVSYTHLDVYKRQVALMACCASNGAAYSTQSCRPSSKVIITLRCGMRCPVRAARS